MHFAAKVCGNGRAGIGDALVHALRAANLANQTPIAPRQSGIVEIRVIRRMQRRREEHSGEDRDKPRHRAASAVRRGQAGFGLAALRLNQRQEVVLPDLRRQRRDVLEQHFAVAADQKRLGRGRNAPIERDRSICIERRRDVRIAETSRANRARSADRLSDSAHRSAFRTSRG